MYQPECYQAAAASCGERTGPSCPLFRSWEYLERADGMLGYVALACSNHHSSQTNGGLADQPLFYGRTKGFAQLLDSMRPLIGWMAGGWWTPRSAAQFRSPPCAG